MGITEDGEGHRFYDGLPSVTTVLEIINEPWLGRWRGRVGNEEADRIANEAAWLGNLVHDTLAANEIADLPIELGKLDPLSQHAVGLYLIWKHHTLDFWLSIEQELTSSKYGFGGTPDRVGHLRGDPPDLFTLVDFKTGARSFKHKFQTAGYKILLRENGIEVGRRVALYLPSTIEKGKSIGVVEHTNHAKWEMGFLEALDIYNLTKGE